MLQLYANMGQFQRHFHPRRNLLLLAVDVVQKGSIIKKYFTAGIKALFTIRLLFSSFSSDCTGILCCASITNGKSYHAFQSCADKPV
jgi:hypothetical protein